MKIDFKKITDDIVSRPSTYLICTYSIFVLFYVKFYLKDIFDLWRVIFGTFHDDGIGIFVYAIITCFFGIILLSIILIESLTELKLKHKIVQNWFVKIIVLPLVLYYLCSIISSVCFMFWVCISIFFG